MLREEAEGSRYPQPVRLAPGRQRLTVVRATTPLIKLIYTAFGGLRAEGLEHVPASGPAIIAANHLSWADPPALRVVLKRRCWFIANDWLLRLPVLGALLPYYGVVPVARSENSGQPDREALRQAHRYLAAGDLLCIFPEGGTSVTGSLHPFENGVAALALRSGAPVVPVGISGSDRMLPMQPPYRPRWSRGGLRIRMGPPMYARTLPGEQRGASARRFTRELYSAIAGLLPDEYLPAEFLQTGVMPDHATG